MQYTANCKSAGKKTTRSRVFSRLTLALMVIFLFVSGGFQLSPAKAEYASITLGSASQFAVLAGTAITNNGITIGETGTRTSGTAPYVATEELAASFVTAGSARFENNSETATTAQESLTALLTAVFSDSLTVTASRDLITNETITPGLYSSAAAAFAFSGAITLDAGGSSSAVFIFRSGSTLGFAAATTIILTNGAQAANVFWIAGSAITVGAESMLSGHIISTTASTIGADSTISGSILSKGALTLQAGVKLTHIERAVVVASPSPSPSESATPTATPSPTESATPTATPSPTESATPTATPTPIPTPTPTPEPAPVVIVPPPYVEPAPVVIIQPAPQPSALPSPTPSPIPEPTPTPTPTPTPEPTPTPTPEPTPTPKPISSPAPAVVVIAPPLVEIVIETQTVDSVVESVTAVVIEEDFPRRSDFAPYLPQNHPDETVASFIGAFAVMSIASVGVQSSKTQGFLAQVARGGVLAAGVKGGRGDRRRTKKSRVSGKRVNFFTRIATALSPHSPLAARTISDANYLRASFGNLSLITYPVALGVGVAAAINTDFQGLPPNALVLAILMALGIADAMAGFIAGGIFALAVVVTGNVHDLPTLMTLAGILLISFSPGILAGAFRPLRRVVLTSSDRWERASDYILASVLSGWIVKQIVVGLPGLSGLDLPITAHADQLGVTAGVLVAVRFLAEDFVHSQFPQRLQVLEPDYNERNAGQKFLSAIMQVTVFALVAQPFIGWKIEFWIGVAIFSTPLLLAFAAEHFPKSNLVDRWLPIGIVELLIVTMSGIYLARVLSSEIANSEKLILMSFVILSLPAMLIKVLSMFGGGYIPTWKSTLGGKALYRMGGLLALGLLLYIIFIGFA